MPVIALFREKQAKEARGRTTTRAGQTPRKVETRLLLPESVLIGTERKAGNDDYNLAVIPMKTWIRTTL